MAEVQWIKLNVGMFDGNSFKKIKKAKIGGESFRDKLTAVWFELMDFAGKCNAGGALIESPEIPFTSIEDIAILIDREPEELNLCMQYYINNRMITVIDDVYMLSNWSKYQNEDGLEKIREQTRKRVAKHRENQKLLACNVTGNVTVTQCNDIEVEVEEDKEKDIECVDAVLYRLDTETLSHTQYEELKSRFSKDILDEVINRIITKPYHSCLNVETITKWCEESKNRPKAKPKKNSFLNYKQRDYSPEQMAELEKMLLSKG